jgi:hypothetical protein
VFYQIDSELPMEQLTMLNLDALPTEYKQALKGRGYSDDEISKMSPKDAFVEYCKWNGLINWVSASDWGDAVWEAVQQLSNTDSKVSTA